ncbi:hypothetical protein SLEP1_g50374 [Rubroshorea leprosula]|uniref:Uncharacterized protein n=1 Tax=Rubroshorea leprosula TaxID=152421 RepID=A0AAV5M0Q2_9ROSI|nr:hypothetical protein SLEP1_g50374 [Rubroshorea leprosula]
MVDGNCGNKNYEISLISYCFVKDGKLNKSHTLHCCP